MTIRLTPFCSIYTDLNFTPSDSDKKYENAGNVRGHPPIQQKHTLQLSRTPPDVRSTIFLMIISKILNGPNLT